MREETEKKQKIDAEEAERKKFNGEEKIKKKTVHAKRKKDLEAETQKN